MSVTIHWRPSADQGHHFEGGTSTDLQTLKQTFGDSLTTTDVKALRGMALAGNSKFFSEVADVVERVGAIDFWGQW